ncbi:MAG: class I SAM-dependent methyltransferase [Opitutae bacterium]|jgi:ubiquinone/menaquinone biosynthesis C-methylase UbiE|nr:class I SAM-dependent methyltransferase [Opitutae bacterium]
MSLRPSKLTFRRIFKSCLSAIDKYETVLDFACADAKHQVYFREKSYFGADVNPAAIDANKLKFADQEKVKFFHSDLLDLSQEIVDFKFDLVVSTHTLSWLSDEKKILAIENLVSLVEPGGSLLLQCAGNEVDLTPEPRKSFERMDIFPYRNFLTRWFESAASWFFGTKHVGGIGITVHHPCSFLFLIPLRVLSLVFSFMDRYAGTDHHVVLFRGKKTNRTAK